MCSVELRKSHPLREYRLFSSRPIFIKNYSRLFYKFPKTVNGDTDFYNARGVLMRVSISGPADNYIRRDAYGYRAWQTTEDKSHNRAHFNIDVLRDIHFSVVQLITLFVRDRTTSERVFKRKKKKTFKPFENLYYY